MWEARWYQGLFLGAALQISVSFAARWRTLHVSDPFDHGCAGWRAVLVAFSCMPLLPSSKFRAEGRLGLGDDLCKKGIAL